MDELLKQDSSNGHVQVYATGIPGQPVPGQPVPGPVPPVPVPPHPEALT